MIANPCFPRWRYAQRLVNPAKVVIYEVQHQRVLVILKLFRKTIRQTRESAHRPSHCEIFGVRRSQSKYGLS
jgi:hypothetical protein